MCSKYIDAMFLSDTSYFVYNCYIVYVYVVQKFPAIVTSE